MSNTRSSIWLDDAAILGRDDWTALLRAVAAGHVVRGATGTDTSLFAAHMLGDESIRLELRGLARQELVEMPISGPPALAPRGRRILAIANGETVMPRE